MHNIQLIVGLGNPGAEYANTRHNAGEDLVRLLADQLGVSLTNDPKFFGLSAKASFKGKDLRLLVPTTFMNRSGQAVGTIANFFKIPVDTILVVHDELDLAPGIARLKKGGGHGGHNGLKDIQAALGNNPNFARLRIGIGHPGAAALVASFVLKRAPQREQELIEQAINKSLSVLPEVIAGDWNKAMKDLHTA
jgi:peptidyl-tRNA hydrolase, PTH1 family